MGHEIAHALLSHTREKISRGLALQASMAVMAIKLDDTKYRGLALQGISFATILALELPNSRSAETESDVLGIEIAAKAGYDPKAAVSLWKKMSKLKDKETNEFFSTHPSSENRISKLQNLSVGKSAIDLFSVLQIGLTIKDRSILYERIERRFENMIEEGLVEEVSELYAKGDLDLKSPASSQVGYRQLKEWCCGNLQLSDSISMSVKATKNLAKRQLTWLRGWDDLQSVSIDFDDRLLTIDELENKVSKMVEEHLLL